MTKHTKQQKRKTWIIGLQVMGILIWMFVWTRYRGTPKFDEIGILFGWMWALIFLVDFPGKFLKMVFGK